MIALTMILKSFLVVPTMLSDSATSNSNKLPSIAGADLRIDPAAKSIYVVYTFFSDVMRKRNLKPLQGNR